MLQSSSDVAGAAYRRRVWTKMIGFVVLAAVVWLQPRIQAWIEGRSTGGANDAAAVPAHDAHPSSPTQRPVDRSRVVITDVDEPQLAEADRLDTHASSETVSRDVKGPGNSRASQPPQSDTARTRSEPPRGQLREIRNNVFESTAGLRYVPGSADNHRIRHVMQHAKDDTTKPIHGVFEGNRDQILAVIDEAYEKARKGDRDVRSEEQNDRLVYTVNLRRKIGYSGGSEGKRKGNPECHYVRIILEDINVVITAYPTQSF